MAADDLLARTPRADPRRGARRARRRALPLHRLLEDRRGGRGGGGAAAPAPLEADARAAAGPRGRRPDRAARRRGQGHRRGALRATTRLDTGALTLRVVRSPHAARHASRSATSTRSSPRIPGSCGSSRRPTCPGANRYGIYETGKDQPVLADGVVRYRGEAVVALVGDAAVVARIRRRRSCRSRGRRCPPLLGIAAARAPGVAAAPRRPPGQRPRPRAAWRAATSTRRSPASAVTATGTFETSFVEHAYIEPEAGTAASSTDGSRSGRRPRRRTWIATSSPSSSACRRTRVRVIPSACGGGFGGKLDLSIQPLLAIAAMVTGPPGPRRLLPAGVDAGDDQAPPGADRGDVRRGRRRPAHRRPLPRRLRHRRLRVVGADRRQPRPGPRDRAVRRAGASRRTTRADPHERPARRRVPRLRRAAGGDRARGAARRPRGRSSASTSSRSGAGTPSARARSTATGQVLAASAGLAACLDALEPALGRAARRGRGVQRAAAAAGDPRPARRRHRGHVVRHRQHVAAQPVDRRHRDRAATGPSRLFSGATDIGQGSATVVAQIAADALGVPRRVARASPPRTRT